MVGNKKLVHASLSDLPDDIIIIIINRLPYSDQLRFRSISKTCFRISNNFGVKYADKLPWIFTYSINKFSNLLISSQLCYLYEPAHYDKKRIVNLKADLLKARPHGLEYGWLLFNYSRGSKLILYSPFSDKIIQLPALHSNYFGDKILISASPDSAECVIFIVKAYLPAKIRISTCRPGDDAWRSHLFDDDYGYVNGMACIEGFLYCSFDQDSCVLGAFNVATQEWRIFTEVQHHPIPLSTLSLSCHGNGNLLQPFDIDIDGVNSYRQIWILPPQPISGSSRSLPPGDL